MAAVDQAESIVRRAHTRHRRVLGLIAGGALGLTLLTGPVWTIQPAETTAGNCQPVFAGRAGTYRPCDRPPNSRADDAIEKLIGSTTVGCALGGAFAGPAGIVPGCVGAAAGNIGW